MQIKNPRALICTGEFYREILAYAGMTNQGWIDAFGVRGYGSPIKICKHILLESPCTLLPRGDSPLAMTRV